MKEALTNLKEKKFFIKEKVNFSINNSLALKGVAIVMLVLFHCFSAAKRYSGFEVNFFPLSEDLSVKIIKVFKICVSIFTFISGYGLMMSFRKLLNKCGWNKKDILKWCVSRFIKLLSGFWIIAILYYIIGQIIDERFYNVFLDDVGILYGMVRVVINFFGLSKFLGTAEFCPTWWYMSIAVLFAISIPLFAKLLEKCGYTGTILLITLVPRILNIDFIRNSYVTFLLVFVVGMIFSEENLLVKIANFKVFKKNKYIDKIIKFSIGTILVLLMFKVYTMIPEKKFWEVRYTIIPVIIICYLYEFILELPIIKNILEFLGKHSMNIFLIHTPLRLYYLTDFIYSQGHFLIIAATLLLISLALSIILELFKRLIKYENIIEKLQIFIKEKIDKYYSIRKTEVE